MFKIRLINIFFLFIINLNPFLLFSIDTIDYYEEIDVDFKGNLIGKKIFNSHLGNYLYGLKNEHVIKTKKRNGLIIEFNTKHKVFYAVYDDKKRIKEIGEGERYFGKIGELSHFHRYSKNGLLKKIDHYKVTEDRITFRYYKLSSTYFYYNKSTQLIKEETISQKNALITKIEYYYNDLKQLIQKNVFNPSKETTIHKYKYDNKNNILQNNIFVNDELLKSINYKYNKNNKLLKIKPLIYKIKYYNNSNKNKLITYYKSDGIEKGTLIFDPKSSQIIELIGYLSNIKSYINYSFKKQPYIYKYKNQKGQEIIEKENNAIYTNFINYSIINNKELNKVQIISDFLGKEFQVKWYNQQNKELFSKIPHEIRLMPSFNLNNLLNVKHLVFGKVISPYEKTIRKEIIVEIYSKKNKKRNWCYFGNGYYYYLVHFSDKEQEFNRIQILKAGFEYVTLALNINQKQTLLKISPTYLKTVD